jgi:ATP-dependent helicase/nuclease subunit A
MSSEQALRREDEAARTAALDARRSLLLQAPAGSGKTAVLVLRYLTLLSKVADPAEILAITFTRKAAAEMRGRVIRALRGELDPTDPTTPGLLAAAATALRHGASRGFELARDPQLLRIQTIDSFSYWLANQLPLASRAGGALQVTERAQELYARAARRTLAAAEEGELAQDAELLFERLDNNWSRLERLLADMLERRAHWLPYVLGRAPQELCAQVAASLHAVSADALARACRLLPPALRAALGALPGIGELGALPGQLPAWQALVALVLTQDGNTFRKNLSVRHLGERYADPSTRAALKDAIAALESLPGARAAFNELRELPRQLSGADAAALGAFARLLTRAALELQTEFAASAVVDYSYVAGAARAALGSAEQPTDLALRAGLALRHLLVDEFQDTSLQQFELVKTLTASWEEGDGRTLFVVGDPMQSIYRFRDAEVGLFIAARSDGVGALKLSALRLAFNFRATPSLIEWTNDVFGAVFPPHDDLRGGAVTFSASLAGRTRAQTPRGPAVLLRLFPEDAAAEARAVAARIGELRSAAPQASIAVLVAAHAHADPIVRELKTLGLSALGVDLVPLAERAAVRDLVQLARALHDLADRSAWLAVLRAPWVGLRLNTLTRLSAPEDRQLLWEALQAPERLAALAAEEQARLLRVRTVLAQALAQRGAHAVATWLEATWLALGAADAYPPEELEEGRTFLAALAEAEAGGEWRGVQDLGRILQGLCSPTPAAAVHPVQIMTMHRAKGLEFDHVLLPALARGPGSSERALLSWVDLPRPRGGSDLLMAPVATLGSEREDLLGALIGRLNSARAREERTRLLYVAATRARESLWLSAAPRLAQTGEPAPDPRSLLARVWPVLKERFEVVAVNAQAGSAAPPGPTLQRLRSDWRAVELPVVAARWHLPVEREALSVPEFSWVGERQRHVGTLVHAYLARLSGQNPLPAPHELAAERGMLAAQLRLLGVPGEERAQATELILAALSRTLQDERGRWILSAGHRAAYSELPLTGLAHGHLHSVKVDRSFIDAAGSRWVIDYKTSRHEGADLEGFLAQELERYRAQLTVYAALARALGPEPVRAGLYFPLLGAFRELP